MVNSLRRSGHGDSLLFPLIPSCSIDWLTMTTNEIRATSGKLQFERLPANDGRNGEKNGRCKFMPSFPVIHILLFSFRMEESGGKNGFMNERFEGSFFDNAAWVHNQIGMSLPTPKRSLLPSYSPSSLFLWFSFPRCCVIRSFIPRLGIDFIHILLRWRNEASWEKIFDGSGSISRRLVKVEFRAFKLDFVRFPAFREE